MAFHARQMTQEVVAFIYIPAKPNDHAGLFILGHIGLRLYVHTGLDEFETVLKFVRLQLFTRNRTNYRPKSVHTERRTNSCPKLFYTKLCCRNVVVILAAFLDSSDRITTAKKPFSMHAFLI